MSPVTKRRERGAVRFRQRFAKTYRGHRKARPRYQTKSVFPHW